MEKPVAGDNEKIFFVIVHYYKDKKTNKQYNPQRTISNLKLINRKVYANKGIKFRVFNKDGFEKLCQENKNVESLINKLYE